MLLRFGLQVNTESAQLQREHTAPLWCVVGQYCMQPCLAHSAHMRNNGCQRATIPLDIENHPTPPQHLSYQHHKPRDASVPGLASVLLGVNLQISSELTGFLHGQDSLHFQIAVGRIGTCHAYGKMMKTMMYVSPLASTTRICAVPDFRASKAN